MLKVTVEFKTDGSFVQTFYNVDKVRVDSATLCLIVKGEIHEEFDLADVEAFYTEPMEHDHE